MHAPVSAAALDQFVVYPWLVIKILAPLVIILLLVCTVILADPPAPKADLVILNRTEIPSFDPAPMSWAQDFRMARLISEGLLRQDVFAHDLRALPGVAERWTTSEDHREFTFTLREDARWSTGERVTAQDFVASWRRMMLPETGADYLTLFRLIDGADGFIALRMEHRKTMLAHAGGETSASRLWTEALEYFHQHVGVRAEDERTLRVRFARPVPYAQELFAFPSFFPVHIPSLERFSRLDPVSGEYITDPTWMRPPHMVCNGPFVLAKWSFKRFMRFERNPHYWNSGAIHVDSIHCPSIDDPHAQVMAFRTGAVDIVFEVSAPYRAEMVAQRVEFDHAHATEIQRLRESGMDAISIARVLPDDTRSLLHVFPAFGTYFYNFNCAPTLPDGRQNPLHDSRVRKALALAVNKKNLVEHVRRIGERPAASLIPPGSIAGYESPAGLGFDPERARSLLAEAGYPNGKGLPPIEILFNKDGGHDLIAQAVAKDWQQNLGLSVQLAMKETKVFKDDLRSGRFMVSRASWSGDYGDPTTFLDVSRSTDNNNDRRYKSAEFDSLLDLAATLTADPASRLAHLSRAEKLLVEDDLPLLPLFHLVETTLFDAHRISGLTPHPRQTQDISRLDLLGDGKGAGQPTPFPRSPAHKPAFKDERP